MGVAAGAGAAQLGLGYGLGIVAWLPATDPVGQSAWLASLAWVVWVAATSTVLGAISADRLTGSALSTVDARPRPTGLVEVAWRVAIALAGAIGALVTVPLVAVPARSAHRADNFVPQFTAGAYTVVGVIIGLLVAIAALNSRAIAANVIATTAWLWALAVVAVVDGVRAGRGVSTADLAVWRFTDADRWYWRNLYLPGALMMLGVALLVGVLAAWPAGRRGDSRVGVAVSGAMGPLLVAAAYFLAAPRLTGEHMEQQSAYFVAPYAVIAGLAGSVLVAAIGPKGARAQQPPRPAKPAKVTKLAKASKTAKPVRQTRAAEEASLSDWAKSLSMVDAIDPAEEETGDARVRVGASAPTDSREGELTDDAYTSPRAYTADSAARAYATDLADEPTTGSRAAPAKKSTPATGRATVKEPLWPEPAPSTESGSTGRKGKSGRRGDRA